MAYGTRVPRLEARLHSGGYVSYGILFWVLSVLCVGRIGLCCGSVLARTNGNYPRFAVVGSSAVHASTLVFCSSARIFGPTIPPNGAQRAQHSAPEGIRV